jgi:hypothetical protein
MGKQPVNMPVKLSGFLMRDAPVSGDALFNPVERAPHIDIAARWEEAAFENPYVQRQALLHFKIEDVRSLLGHV